MLRLLCPLPARRADVGERGDGGTTPVEGDCGREPSERLELNDSIREENAHDEEARQTHEDRDAVNVWWPRTTFIPPRPGVGSLAGCGLAET